MSTNSQRQHMRLRERAMRVYQWLLCLYPAAHRHAFGEQMLQAFRDHYRDAVETNGERVWWFWLEVLADVVRSARRERGSACEGGLRVSWIWSECAGIPATADSAGSALG